MEIWQKNAIVNIRNVISELSQTQLAFAKNAKISKSHLNMVLKERLPVTRQLVATIAAYVGKNTDWFYQDHSGAEDATNVPGPTFSDALTALQALEKAKPARRALSLFFLTDDPSYLAERPEFRQAAEALSRSLKSIG